MSLYTKLDTGNHSLWCKIGNFFHRGMPIYHWDGVRKGKVNYYVY